MFARSNQTSALQLLRWAALRNCLTGVVEFLRLTAVGPALPLAEPSLGSLTISVGTFRLEESGIGSIGTSGGSRCVCGSFLLYERPIEIGAVDRSAYVCLLPIIGATSLGASGRSAGM